jgi:WD40 repeat protein
MLWNYFTKEKTIKKFPEEPKCFEYSPDGKYLMNATSKGLIRILDPLTMKEIQAPCKISENNLCAINMITVASDSQQFATMDAKNCV